MTLNLLAMAYLRHVLIMLLCFISIPEILACSCANQLFVNRIAQSEFVANVTVLRVDRIDSLEKYHSLDIRTNELFKGDSLKSILVYSHLNSSCAFLPKAGSTWLIFAQRHNGKLSISFCSGNQEITESKWKNERYSQRHYESVMRKIGFLRFISDNGIVLKNIWNLSMPLDKDGVLKGFENKESDFTLYEIKVNKRSLFDRLTIIKGFENVELNRLIRKKIRASLKSSTLRKNLSNNTETLHFALFYYAETKNDKSFVSVFAL